eukprot:scaffold1741_cov409-Prasinococcus_capsulatus_cf.AAC.9
MARRPVPWLAREAPPLSPTLRAAGRQGKLSTIQTQISGALLIAPPRSGRAGGGYAPRAAAPARRAAHRGGAARRPTRTRDGGGRAAWGPSARPHSEAYGLSQGRGGVGAGSPCARCNCPW